MNKITPEHLSRGAIVYIRQSTPGQVANNLESNTDGLVRLLTHLVGTGKRWDGETERLGSFRFDHQFVLGRSLYRQVDIPLMRVWGS